ncbi:Scr1 family TA system antitoxin-like transcriptional regulator [Streptomyces sp. NPDC057362]|uniref:Scr1 family TA system antitoxin-like transcriptional regulator n=1 Tax=Streptomyces sp. NPDC057362 TaxID=3346106 RepID=UPI00362D10DF
MALRLSRQGLLHRQPLRSVRVILDEGALRRRVQDAKVWRDQLTHLLGAAELPSVVLQVLPYTAGGTTSWTATSGSCGNESAIPSPTSKATGSAS